MGPVQRHTSRAEAVQRLVHLLARAASAGANLAVFPEMAMTTFFPRWDLSEPSEIDGYCDDSLPGPHTRPLFDAARRLRIGFALGFAELVRDGRSTRRFNAMALVGPEGEIVGCYRKMHVPGTVAPEAHTTVHLERRYFEPGNLGFPVFSYCGIPTGLAICNDRRWPETYRMLCLNGAVLVLIGYNTPLALDEAPELDHLRMFHNHLPMQAGAYQNAMWVAAAAKAGIEEGQALLAGSCIIAPSGEIVAEARTSDDEVVLYRADLDLVRRCRRVNFDFARYRRPSEYGLIAERAGPPPWG